MCVYIHLPLGSNEGSPWLVRVSHRAMETEWGESHLIMGPTPCYRNRVGISHSVGSNTPRYGNRAREIPSHCGFWHNAIENRVGRSHLVASFDIALWKPSGANPISLRVSTSRYGRPSKKIPSWRWFLHRAMEIFYHLRVGDFPSTGHVDGCCVGVIYLLPPSGKVSIYRMIGNTIVEAVLLPLSAEYPSSGRLHGHIVVVALLLPLTAGFSIYGAIS